MNYPIIHADRDYRFHEKLKTAFVQYPDFQFLDHCCYLDAALPLLAKHQPAMLLTASKLFDEANVAEAFCAYRDENMPGLKIIVLTSKENIDHFLNSISAGVNGYISKWSPIEEIHQCMKAIINGDNYLGVYKQAISHK